MSLLAGDLYIRQVNLLDFSREDFVGEMDIWVKDGRIHKILPSGPPSQALPVSSDQVIDGSDRYLIPGLIDCHVHLISPFYSPDVEVKLEGWMLKQIKKNLAAFPRVGVTWVRDLLSPITLISILKRLTETGYLSGPDIVFSGPIFSTIGGYPDYLDPLPGLSSIITGQMKVEIDSSTDLDRYFKFLSKMGATFIKVGFQKELGLSGLPPLPLLSPSMLDKVVKRAHANHLKVAIHVCEKQQILQAAESGVDSIEHIAIDGILDDRCFDLILDKGIIMVPTLHCSYRFAHFETTSDYLHSPQASERFEPKALRILRPISRKWSQVSVKHRFKDVKSYRREYDINQKNARICVERGVTLATGTDGGAFSTFMGDTIEEIKNLYRAGLSRLEALKTATLNAAQLLSLEDRLKFTEGCRADLVLLSQNPLKNLDNLYKVEYTIKNGRVI